MQGTGSRSRSHLYEPNLCEGQTLATGLLFIPPHPLLSQLSAGEGGGQGLENIEVWLGDGGAQNTENR
jgi:hypothetical protein